MGFQSEAKQLLHLMIHSLYSNKEVFLRELISNASDAADRLRFAALTDGSLMEADPDLKIRVDFDKKARTITVSDNGIGMTRQEAIDHLGTIAKSGTASFLQSLSGDKRKDSQLIGQFGVGFYSSFIVADKVTVETRKAGLPPTEGVRWVSSGESEFEVETIDRPARGTSVILHLKKEELDFADQWRLQTIVKKYADHISIPVIMKVEPFSSGEDDKKPEPEDKVINTAKALWTRPRTELKDEEYQEFYRHISHDFQDPIAWSHNKVEGKLDYTSLIYIPAKAPFDLYQREAPRGLKLYVQRIFIMDDAEQFLPLYLRFVKGVVDSNDLSLNVSREILQKEPAIETIRGALTKRVLDMLEKLAKKEPEKYASFWSEFGQVLKEGPAEDHANRERIAKLLRFATTFADSKGQDQSLESYVGRMRPEQKKIYYVAAESYQTASRSPHLEVFRRKGVEVLLLHDRIDEWLMSHLSEFDGKQFQDVARGNLDLDALDETEKAQQEQAAEEFKGLVERVREVLGEQVADVRITHRLVESPACLVVGEHDMGMQMRRILEAAGQKPRESKRIFEINPGHPLVKRLNDEQDLDRFGELTRILLDQAQLAEGGQLEDPATYVQRLNKLLLELSA